MEIIPKPKVTFLEIILVTFFCIFCGWLADCVVFRIQWSHIRTCLWK